MGTAFGSPGGLAPSDDERPAHIEADEHDTLAAEKASSSWVRLGGSNLEPFLQVDPELKHSPVRLVDARYLLRSAGYVMHDRAPSRAALIPGMEPPVGEPWSYSPQQLQQAPLLRRRQELPAEAFLSLCDLQQMDQVVSTYGDCLRILVVSHPWLQPDHCDPLGRNLKILAQAVAAYLEQWGGTFGIFLDFMSLHQKDNQGRRTDAERALFTKALDSLSELYSHLFTPVFKLTKLPGDYPLGYTFASGSRPNKADYQDRGWCFFEASIANFKDFRLVLDLGVLHPAEHQYPSGDHSAFHELRVACALRAGRQAPLLPADFARRLRGKSFTSKKADLHVVQRLYAQAFTARLAEARELIFQDLGWTDDDAAQLARVVASGVMLNLQRLSVARNAIGDAGMRRLAAAIRRRGALPAIRALQLNGNPGDIDPVWRALKSVTPADFRCLRANNDMEVVACDGAVDGEGLPMHPAMTHT